MFRLADTLLFGPLNEWRPGTTLRSMINFILWRIRVEYLVNPYKSFEHIWKPHTPKISTVNRIPFYGIENIENLIAQCVGAFLMTEQIAWVVTIH